LLDTGCLSSPSWLQQALNSTGLHAPKGARTQSLPSFTRMKRGSACSGTASYTPGRTSPQARGHDKASGPSQALQVAPASRCHTALPTPRTAAAWLRSSASGASSSRCVAAAAASSSRMRTAAASAAERASASRWRRAASDVSARACSMAGASDHSLPGQGHSST